MRNFLVYAGTTVVGKVTAADGDLAWAMAQSNPNATHLVELT